MTVGYCPAPEMIGDHFTKPLKQLHSVNSRLIMNNYENVLDVDLAWERELVPTMLQECVGNNVALVSVY